MYRYLLQSEYTNTNYDITVFVPETEVPENGFPVIYVLDGLSYYRFVRDGIRLQHVNNKKTGVNAAIVVGIAHKKEEMREKRFLEFTAPSELLVVAEHAKGKIPEEFGGAERFLAFIEKELKPMIESEFTIDKRAQSLFGHSLGGYFALWCLFNHSATFDTYLAISPSVWWNDKELVTMCKKYLARQEESDRTDEKGLFIAVGEKERLLVEQSKEIVTLFEEQQLPIEYYVAPDENHASVVPTVMSRALRFGSRW